MADPKPSDTSPARKRFPADQRRKAMLDGGATFFAQRGFSAPTRDLADALGVTQALIYKHFKSKAQFIEKTLDYALGGPTEPTGWSGAPETLAGDLATFYRGFVARSTETRMRLFMRAGLDGQSWPTKRGSTLTNSLFVPVIGALRSLAGAPPLAEVAPMRGERELMMMLHASMVFLGIRRHVYGMPMPENLDDVVDLYVDTFMRGAVPTMAALHNGAPDSLKTTLMVPPPEPGTAKVSSRPSKRAANT